MTAAADGEGVAGPSAGTLVIRSRGGLQGGPDAVGVRHREAADDQGGRHQGGARQGMRTPSRGAGAADDGGARPALVGAVLRQPRSIGRISVAAISRCSTNCTRASSRRRSASSSGRPTSRACSSGEAVDSSARTSALRDRREQRVEGVEGRAELGVELAVAVEDAGGVPPLRVGEHVGPYPRLGVVEPLQLGPAVPGRDEGVADRAARRGQVTGQRERLDEQPVAGLGVEDVELLGIGHGPLRYAVGPRLRKSPAAARPPAWHPGSPLTTG